MFYFNKIIIIIKKTVSREYTRQQKISQIKILKFKFSLEINKNYKMHTISKHMLLNKYLLHLIIIKTNI